MSYNSVGLVVTSHLSSTECLLGYNIQYDFSHVPRVLDSVAGRPWGKMDCFDLGHMLGNFLTHLLALLSVVFPSSSHRVTTGFHKTGSEACCIFKCLSSEIQITTCNTFFWSKLAMRIIHNQHEENPSFSSWN